MPPENPEILPNFPKLLPLVPEKQGIGARIIEIREMLHNRGIPTKNPFGFFVTPG
jgi:hypothetical protein